MATEVEQLEQRRLLKCAATHVIVLFGATGDLAKRKLFPGLFHLVRLGLLPTRLAIVGAARREVSQDEFRRLVRDAVAEAGRDPAEGPEWDDFEADLSFVSIGDGAEALAAHVHELRDELGGAEVPVLHYLSLPPSAADGVVAEIGRLGLADGARVIMEKPFGVDLASARRLNAAVHEVFNEDQVFRIDHFLGKEAVQNILAIRFANGMFEPVWNSNHIDHVQIEVPETLSVAGRGSFYEQTGAYRDMVVTHLFQLLGFVAMEPPLSLEAGAVATERHKVFDAMRPLASADVVRGQYTGYRSEPGVDPGSETETFVGLRAHVDNWRWAGVPFYLRTGKRMASSSRLLTVAFKRPPRRMFAIDDRFTEGAFGPDHLNFDLGDPGSITATFLAKVPGPGISLGQANMGFSYADSLGGPDAALEAYERLIHDVMMGDRMLFADATGIERLWEISDEMLRDPPPVETYDPGSWGPASVDELIAPRHWHGIRSRD